MGCSFDAVVVHRQTVGGCLRIARAISQQRLHPGIERQLLFNLDTGSAPERFHLIQWAYD
jgi:muramoyltetrapeptide carboxypeptidase LdcA involved in peptidoglycan recycling